MVNEVGLEKPSRMPAPNQLLLAGLATLSILGISGYTAWRYQAPPVVSPSPPALPQLKTVTALGRLEPRGEVIRIATPTSAEGNRVAELRVKEGDRVQKGQVIAVLDSRDRLQASLEQAQEQVRVAQANLAKVQAGAKSGEIEAQRAAIARLQAEKTGDEEAQQATLARLQAELRNAQAEDQRYEDLYRQGAISASLRDSKRLGLETAQEKVREAEATLNRTSQSRQQQIGEARATLDRIAEVRPVDVQVAEAEVRSAQATVKQAQTKLEDAYIRAPQAGQILKIHAYVGELVGTDGMAEMGQTDRMVAVAEVYESDVSQIKVGQPVKITSDAVAGEFHGTVERIGLRVQKQNVINADPSANVDARIVEVRVKLDKSSSQRLAGFTNLQVKTVIEVGHPETTSRSSL